MFLISNTKARRTSPATPAAALDTLSPHRFWDETMRVPGMFERFRNTHDLPNAIACFDHMARDRYREISNHSNFDLTKPSVISVFQPKSGGTYLHNRMLELGYQEFWWCFPDHNCASRCYAGIEALELYNAGGCTCHAHARPDANILAALDRARVKKVWLHLRNPAESVVSAFYHYLGQGHGEGSIGEQRKNEALVEASRAGLAPGMDLSTFVIDAIPFFVGWVADWLRFVNRHPELVVLSYFSELSDPQKLFSRVFDELGIAFGGIVTVEPTPLDRIRRRRSASWQSDLSTDARHYLEQRIRGELGCFPQFAQLWNGWRSGQASGSALECEASNAFGEIARTNDAA